MKNKITYSLFALVLVSILGISLISAYGFGNGNSFFNSGMTDEERTMIQAEQETIQTAIESNDYATWETAMNQRNLRMQERINQETFNAMQERHQEMTQIREAIELAKESGDFSEVETLKEQYGLEKMGPGSKGKGSGNGLGEGSGKNNQRNINQGTNCMRS